MSSGKYGAISGAVARMQMLENISERLAAVKVPGYKKEMVTFEARLGEAKSGMATKGTNFTRLSQPEIDFTPGHIEYSGDPLDLAINGDGFFQIQRPDGTFGYARKGDFGLNAEGQLIDTNGYPVMGTEGGNITLPGPNVSILTDGTIWDSDTRIGQVALFRFADTAVLKRAGGDMFVPSDDTQPEAHPNPQMSQQNLESSNVDMMKSMIQMTSNLRAFEATQKALQIYSDMGSKAADIGLVQ
ncbi:flagellar basal-body rod protein FlgG [Desulfuromusa kysingii]|uniref:Flagellar basal-body rod protein FlgG n=1 Tax=Desulfuromusa kysingii TaxID=37625 RepID=A0A1H3VIC2_9BACT|nr:flagellar hook basal-body protein [Desulfuromusa kysingii]SDZ73862.1 flagellar basal-body rod protein FlgG [Desulfuromusa kysingii]